MICTDMHDWLLPEEMEEQFQPLFTSCDEAQWDYDPYFWKDREDAKRTWEQRN